MPEQTERNYLNDLAGTIIGSSYEVSNQLGVGFLEKVYERSLACELTLRGIKAETQKKVRVFYKERPVGDYYADILVQDKVIVEIKCVEAFAPEHMAQCLNYLKATGLSLALLVNFKHPKVDVQRVVLGF